MHDVRRGDVVRAITMRVAEILAQSRYGREDVIPELSDRDLAKRIVTLCDGALPNRDSQ